MYLYNVTLKQSTSITQAVVGQFLGTREDHKKGNHEIALAKGKVLEILKPNPSTGKLESVISVNVFGIIRSIAAFRLTGGFKDYLVVGSESGRIVILEYLPDRGRFDKIHEETFGRSGVRRIVPGQYLACDSKGRAVMIGAVEKQKLVYQLNRDTQANLTISSPLEANKANTLVFHMINVDVGYENPLFACLELDYEDADEDPTGEAAAKTKQTLTYYELDLGLNHVVRKYSEPLDEFANLLISVPGGFDGPSGLIVCSENYITYKNFGDQSDIRCPIPRRKEIGDIFKTEFQIEDDIVKEITMTYFDTVPRAVSLCLLPHSRRHVEGALLFVGAESGNHHLYQIDQIIDQEVQSFSSKTYERLLEEAKQGRSVDIDMDTKIFQFKPSELRNLILVDEIHSAAPILSSAIYSRLDENQLLLTCGTGRQSSLRVLRQGVEVTERAVTHLPSVAIGVWSVKKRCDSIHDRYIVVSFSNATLVLGVGETIEEIVDSGFLGTKSTLACAQLGDDSMVQVHADGIRHIHADKRVSEWRAPARRQIVKCALNQRQVAVALNNNDVLYFEMDTTGQLNEYNERKELPSPVTCMALGEVPSGDVRSQFLAIGTEQKVFVISLDLSDCMSEIVRQTFSAAPESIAIAELDGLGGSGRMIRDLTSTAGSQLYLNVGLKNGELVRTRLDRVSGDLSEPIRRYLGNKPVRVFPIRAKERQAVLACTNRTWLTYYHQGRCHLSPLSYEPFDHAAAFSSAEIASALVAISGNTLRILSLDHLGDVFNQKILPLDTSPRRFVTHPESGNVVVMMTDRLPLLIGPDDPADRWRSLLKVIDPQTGQVFQEIAFESDQAATCLALTTFAGATSATIHVGVATNHKLTNRRPKPLTKTTTTRETTIPTMATPIPITTPPPSSPRQATEPHLPPSPPPQPPRSPQTIEPLAEIYTYRLVNGGQTLELLHRTSCESVPTAMCAFQDRLAVGTGRLLRIYDLGKKKLLRKCETKQTPHQIAAICSSSSRLFVSDVQESVTFMKYRKQENAISVFADDTCPRYVVASGTIDHNTVAISDKFGNLFVLQLPDDASDELDDDPTGTRSLWDRGWLGGVSQKVETVAVIHIGEVVTSIHQSSLTLGRAECIIYTTISGSIGALIPMRLKEEFEAMQTLEMHLRSQEPALCGRDHLAFASSYFPTKNVVDGDLCERFLVQEPAIQQKIADEMERKVGDISLQIDQMIERII